MAAGVVTVRPFQLLDLDAAARFCEAARMLDGSIEPFAQRLGLIATGTRALLEAWRVAEGEDGAVYGIAFLAVRDQATFDVYAAVHPSLRRQGLGRALCEGALASGAVLRARVRDDAAAGRAFLTALGFAERQVQLSLQWRARELPVPEMPALRMRRALPKDQAVLQRLSREAWTGAPDTFATRPDEIAQLFGEEGRVLWLAESEGKPMAYLSGVQLGRTLGIEEIAVLPDFRRMGIGGALLAKALAGQQAAVLSVGETNKPARALYKSFGFTLAARRLIFERAA
ncbi:MAG TPA: GNAT family N-acetyltransferase [Myxococcales bacterium]|nr:GNAT family N-acetyltransferase [Myxococcales bacterium]